MNESDARMLHWNAMHLKDNGHQITSKKKDKLLSYKNGHQTQNVQNVLCKENHALSR